MARLKRKETAKSELISRIERERASRRNKKIERIIFIVFFMCLCIFLFSVRFSVVYKHNSIRDKIETNSSSTEGKITEVHNGRRDNYAKYEFECCGRKYFGKTFYKYEGNLGDIIRVDFATNNPEINVYSKERTIETFIDAVLEPVLTASFVLLIYFVFSIFMKKYFNINR